MMMRAALRERGGRLVLEANKKHSFFLSALCAPLSPHTRVTQHAPTLTSITRPSAWEPFFSIDSGGAARHRHRARIEKQGPPILRKTMAAVDTLLARVRGDTAPDDDDGGLRAALGRFAVTKRSWRGRYRRLLSVTPTALVTQQPDTLAVTNVWRFSGDDPDVEGVAVGPAAPPGAPGELELTLTVRSDAKVRERES